MTLCVGTSKSEWRLCQYDLYKIILATLWIWFSGIFQKGIAQEDKIVNQ